MKEAQGEDETEGKNSKEIQTHHPGEIMDGHDMKLFKLSIIQSQ